MTERSPSSPVSLTQMATTARVGPDRSQEPETDFRSATEPSSSLASQRYKLAGSQDEDLGLEPRDSDGECPK